MDTISYTEAKMRGLTRYFTGKSCRQGHIAERKTANRSCIECQRLISLRLYDRKKNDPLYVAANRARARRWEIDNQERYREAQKRARSRTIEQRRKYDAEWRKKNVERVKARLKRLAENDPDIHKRAYHKRKATDPDYTAKQRAWSRRWRQANLARYNAKNAEWRARNPERAKQIAHAGRINRRARENGAGNCPPEVLSRIRTSSECAKCGRTDGPMEIDHIIPLSRGGRNEEANLQLLCRPCNRKKWAKMPQDTE